MKRDEAVYLRHILDAIARAQEYLLEVDEASFQRRPPVLLYSGALNFRASSARARVDTLARRENSTAS